ncbi:retrovirus-related Pol polyprotein from transposon 17.6 [Trichonephila clavata]|uniref:RNA-directed DNA polymerase n=1 Tax=Trichonephila clavata TaxID=2740835 RepID=A0A8X6LCR9_TRICU|nr:retrovirus-related Pol polyprotein from transposon 17.6 [Trichonephila clavata]
MANDLPTIPAFEPGTNPSESWRHRKEGLEDYLEALRYSEAPEKTKTALFRHLCGEELKKQLRAFDLKPNDGCEGFLEIKQEQGEKFTDYYSRLRNAVDECNYGESQDRMLRDKIIQGLLDKVLQERLIRETSKKAKTLQEVVSECKAAENSKVQASVMNEKLSVNALKNFRKDQNQSMNNQKNEVNCKQCGKIHEKKKCPAYGTKCRNCDGRNHWAKMCRTQRNKQKNVAARRVNVIEENCENSETICIGELKSVNELDMKETNCVWYEKIYVNKTPVMFKLDTGSQMNVIPKLELLKWEEKPAVRKYKTAVLDYSDNRVPILVLPFGLNSAPEEFQKAMDEIYEEDEDINPYFDDIALGSSTVEEHCRLLCRTLLKARKANLKFNELKTQLLQTSVNYLGHVLSDEGIKPDPKKIRTIEQFATPNCKEDLQRFLAAQPYWHCKEELYSTKERIICRGQRLVVPVKYGKEILKLLHVSHKGVVSSKIKAREYFYWPNLNRDVEEYVPKCKICQKYQRENQKEILINPEIPGRPWQKVTCDFFCLKSKEHLLMIDYLSKYVELKPLNSTTAQSVITVMKSIYATHGIPEDLSKRTNREIERGVQTVKNSLNKAAEEEKDLYIVLLDYRIQPAKDMPSPAELLMGRKLRTFLPSHPGQLKPTFDVERAREALRKRQIVQNKYANKHATVLNVLHQNAKVWFQHKMKKPWKQGTIIQVGPQPRSYIIKGEDEGVFRRNRFHIRQDYTEDDNPCWSRTVEDVYNSDATEISRIPNNSADSQVNASPKINKSNINQQLQVPIEN